ncbi:hypothetical protein [Gimesia algae]|uniref:Uncharacterized protein n=1 Tax=Gimesia algae TaxID=2527971 RepID=A0A517VFF3_9PLAN|nr:hypothetical protein [Gimesia algae]QDT91748.1 hypothetical protein Pan161_34110 [Gimesia algae]
MSKVATINNLHNNAMDAANKAYVADLHGDFNLAESLFREAFEKEREAAILLKNDLDTEPTRSVLFRSAATLGIDCREFREAERLIAIGLSGNPPDQLCDELRDVLETVYFSRHLSLRGVGLDPGEVQMSLTGSAVGFGLIESKQFVYRAEVVEKLLVRGAERLKDVPFRESGSPNTEALQGFEVFYSVPRAASFAISIRLGRPQRQMTLPGFVGVQDVVDDFLACISDFNAGEGDSLKDRIESDAYFNNFRALAKKLAPDGTKINNVGFTSIRGEESKEASLSHPSNALTNQESDNSRTERLVGEIHKADETKRGLPTFGVQDDSGKVHNISVPAGLLNDIVKPYWGERVQVIALRKSKKKLELVDIDPVIETAQGDDETH